MSDSIVENPMEFARQWYDVDDIHRCITDKLNPAFGTAVGIPKLTLSREFAEWLAGEYRLAMCKGVQLSVGELRQAIDDYKDELEAKKRRLPNAVKQTTPTNCFRACVATVLNIPIDEVPIACDGDGAHWNWDAFQDWLAGRGLQAIEVTFGNGGTIYPVRKPVTCILTGKSPRECTTGLHAVVAEFRGLEGFWLLHDPHPSESWIEDGDPTHATFFVAI